MLEPLKYLIAAGIGLGLAAGAMATEQAPLPADASHASAVWYADNSCRLKVDDHEEVGVTSIDADMNEAEAHTMINCDAESGRRLTLMLQGSGLTLGERKLLATPDALNTEADVSVAWITHIRQSTDGAAPDEVTTRRYFSHGTVIIRESPGVDTSESTLHADRQAFAEINGALEPGNKGRVSNAVTPVEDVARR